MTTPHPHPYDSLPGAVAEIFGPGASAERAYDLLTVDVPAADWLTALETARDRLGCSYFDWLSAVDEPGTGYQVCAHVAALAPGAVRRLLLRTTVPHTAPTLPSAVGVYAGAAWHERETHEMFGVVFADHPNLTHLLLPDTFEGHPLRKDFVLAARVAKAWPGAKEPGESDHGGPKRRQMLPPGVPDPNEWGPLKGQLPPAAARPTRTARTTGDRPVRRSRSASEGSASQAAAPTPEASPAATPPRRARSVSEGSATQRRARSASEGSATQRRARSVSEGSAGQRSEDGEASRPAAPTPPRTRSADAPWNNPRPAFTDPEAEPPAEQQPEGKQGREQQEPEPETGATSKPPSDTVPVPEPDAASVPAAEAEPEPGAEPEPEPGTETGAAPASAPEPDRPDPEAGPAGDGAPAHPRRHPEGDA
ncbi:MULTISPECIES: NADH-quinone oxidoreductase subunit C [unclassified Streptomyces]|uniref:NADH-quinone oxidoreductase subunit C n=1 Tax=unclassified Streptomyces TaxID=2593676 RepID=UPI0009A0B105|nr:MULTISPECIES: NADH-quinone oxidoreductase subunit C [unclassified Streptomyces]